MKQKQFSPLSVEKQTAIIYLGTNGLLQNIPVARVKEFESDFLNVLEAKHKNVLDSLRAGSIGDNETSVLKTVAKEVETRYFK